MEKASKKFSPTRTEWTKSTGRDTYRKATIAIARTDRVKLLGQNMVLSGQRLWYTGS
jgi:hypothetical protein